MDYNDSLTRIDFNTFYPDTISDEQKDTFKAILEANSDGSRRRKYFDPEPTPSSTDESDWKQWIKKVRHDRPPSETAASLADLERFNQRRPYDVFLVKTGAQNDFLTRMRLHFQQNCFRTFLDGDMRDLDGPPTQQMRFALENITVCCVHDITGIFDEEGPMRRTRIHVRADALDREKLRLEIVQGNLLQHVDWLLQELPT